MLEKDNAKQAVRDHAEAVKRSTTLQSENQSPKFSGHESAPYGEGGPDAAGPSSHAPGK